MNDYKDRIVKVLRESDVALDIEKIRVRAKIGNWQTALKHCLELVIAKKIDGQRSSNGWIFWVKQQPVSTVSAKVG